MDAMDEREAIRQRKRKELIERLEGESTTGPVETPTQPIHIQHLDEFDTLVERHRTVLVDFYAEWCGPCKQLDPVVQELADESPAAVVKVNIDAHQSLAQRHGVRGVPTLVLYAESEPVERLVGMQSKRTLSTLLAQYT